MTYTRTVELYVSRLTSYYYSPNPRHQRHGRTWNQSIEQQIRPYGFNVGKCITKVNSEYVHIHLNAGCDKTIPGADMFNISRGKGYFV